MTKLFITTLAASLLLFASSNAAAQAARARVSDTAIRAEANLGSETMATLNAGDLLHVVDLQGDWYRVIVPNEQGAPRTGFVPANLIEIVSEQELQESPQLLIGTAIRAASPVAQGPPIPPTLAQITQQRAQAAEHAQALITLALERDEALVREQELRSEVEALKADPNAVLTHRPIRQIHADKALPPKPKYPQAREGFWFNAGLGFGSYGCETCLERIGGGSGAVSLGGTINNQILLGGGTAGYYRSFDDGSALTVGTVDARARFYPVRASGFFATGGLGFGSISAGRVGFHTTESGIAAVLGLGWDIPLRANLSFTPFWNGIGVSTATHRAGFSQLGVGITVH
jgi:hypothetical protein